jgi:SOS response regulatory protein OraA/RecX
MPQDPAVERAREAALRLLDRSRKTRKELERRLRDKVHAPEAIAQALDRLAGVGLVDDAEYARAYARAKFARRPVALRVVRQELARRGVSATDVELGLARLAADEHDAAGVAGPPGAEAGAPDPALAERARAERALAPLLRRYRGLDPRERRARCAAALARRGFAYGLVDDLLAGLAADPMST